MIDYGEPPATDEIEVTLFGPGYGEAIAIHLGEGAWILVDSCIDPESKYPASATYLKQIGVDVERVRAIVASHWHDDHVRGIAKLASVYPNADFIISAVFNNKEATAFLAGYSGDSSLGLARGAKELHAVLRAREKVSFALHRTTVLEATLNARQVRVTALSPMSGAFAQSLAHFAQYLPTKGRAINHAPEIRPNFEAIALHIDLGEDAVLLGSDLENHNAFGWSAVVADQWSGTRKPATAYKVAHHGSFSGHCPEVWSVLLTPTPVACVTPFTLGDLRLPTDADKERVKGATPLAFISSGASRRPDMDSRQLKRLADICKKLVRVDAGFGAVRLRRKLGAPAWSVELFGAAQAL